MKRSIIKNIIFFLILGSNYCLPNHSTAQLAPLFLQSIRSQELLNPAYNADKDYVSAILIHRNQWYDINNSPKILGVNIRFPILINPLLRFGGLGAAVNVLSETLGLRNTTIANIVVDSYIQIAEDTYLGVGISGGVEFFQYDITRLIDIEDPLVINSLILKGMKANIGVGLLCVHKNYRFGFSTIATARQSLDETKLHLVPSADIFLRATYNLSQQVEIMPAILVKCYNKFSPNIDVSATFIFNDMLSANAGYRFSESFFTGCGIKLKDLFWLSYTFEYPFGGISKLGKGSHEISLSFGMNKNHYKGNRVNEFR